MRILNRHYRGVDRTTDVLSFPQNENSSLPPFSKRGRGGITNCEFVLGDIVINIHKAKRQAAENRIAFDEELKRLLIHGLLHLMGYDHENSKYAEKRMQKKALELLHHLGNS